MKSCLLVYCISLFLSLLVVEAEEVRLVDTLGRELLGTAEDFDGQVVKFRRGSDGRLFTISLHDLSAESKEMLAERFASRSELEPNSSSLKAGTILTLDFPELGKMAKNQPTQCEIHIPASYSEGKVFPLLVWFNGGKGSHRVGSARGLVDFDQFVVAAIPYPDGRLPRLAVEDGKVDEFWEYQQPILEAIQKTVPNLSEAVRIAGGFSSGGHLVGSALDQNWKGFTDFFTAFVLHEGGTSPQMEYRGLRSKHKVLVTYGKQSTSLEWQLYFNEKMKAAHRRAEFISIENCGHALNQNARSAIRGWIDAELLPDLER